MYRCVYICNKKREEKENILYHFYGVLVFWALILFYFIFVNVLLLFCNSMKMFRKIRLFQTTSNQYVIHYPLYFFISLVIHLYTFSYFFFSKSKGQTCLFLAHCIECKFKKIHYLFLFIIRST